MIDDRTWVRFAAWLIEWVPAFIYAVAGSLLWVAAVSSASREKVGARTLFGIGVRNFVVATSAAMLLPVWLPDLESGKVLVGVLLAGFFGDAILYTGYVLVQKGKEDPVGTLKSIIRRWAGKGHRDG